MSEIVVYTVIIGAYEPLMPPWVYHPSLDYVCLTDIPFPDTWPWEQRIVSREIEDPARESRRFKILSHRFFPNAKYTLYHDGNIRLKTIDFLGWLTEHDIAQCAHPFADCVYEGAEAAIEAEKGDPEIIRAQLARYRAEGFPERGGLAGGSVILRKHTEAVRQFNEAWWDEMVRGSRRDLVSFNYVCWKLGMGYDVIPGDLYHNDTFEYVFPSWHLPPEEEIWL